MDIFWIILYKQHTLKMDFRVQFFHYWHLKHSKPEIKWPKIINTWIEPLSMIHDQYQEKRDLWQVRDQWRLISYRASACSNRILCLLSSIWCTTSVWSIMRSRGGKTERFFMAPVIINDWREHSASWEKLSKCPQSFWRIIDWLTDWLGCYNPYRARETREPRETHRPSLVWPERDCNSQRCLK